MNSFTRPRYVKGNNRQAIMADDMNNHARAIEELQNALMGTGTRSPFQAKRPEASTIVPVSYRMDGDAWKVKFNSAKLPEHSLINAGVMHEIKLNGSNLTAETPPEMTLSSGDNEVWLTYELETDGTVISGTPEIFTGEAPTTSPMEPVRPEGADQPGIEGQQLGIIRLEDGKSPVWIAISPHIVSSCYCPGIQNLGDGLSLWSDYDAAIATDNWRTLKQLEGPGVAIIATEEIDIGETIDFRRVKEREDTTPQIHVLEDSDEILIKGNDVDANISLATKISMSVRDGLVTSLSADATESAIHANVHIYSSAFDSEGKLAEPDYLTLGWLYFRFGMLVKVEWESVTWGEVDDTGIDPEDIAQVVVNRNFVME